MTESDTHFIRRLRFRGGLDNPRLVRQRVEAALSDGVEASRLGKEAILCVRRIAIPLRRVEKLKDALEAETFAAARPVRGPVPANANAVLFADRAELLACLARDWCAGNSATLWWWPVLFPRDDFGAVVRRAWLKDARPVPAALARLESAGLAPRFLAKLPPVDLATLRRNIVNTFHLEALDAAWSVADTANATTGRHLPRKTAPWQAWINPPASLAMDAAQVLITAVLLERAPARVRSISFTREIQAWSEGRRIRRDSERAAHQIILPEENASAGEFAQNEPAPITSRSTLARALPTAERIPRASPPNAESSAGQPVLPLSRHRKRSTSSRIPKQESSLAHFQKDESISSSPATNDHASLPAPLLAGDEMFGDSRTRDDQSRRAGFTREGPISAATDDIDSSVALAGAVLPDRIATDWGGLLYLVNVAVSLELYGDFTAPGQTGLALSLWDFLALLGGRMIGEEFANDPLPCLFARLSGRAEEEPPAAHFEPPTGEPLEIWLERICHDVRRRVAAAMGLCDDCDLRALVLKQPARIETDSTRLDAYFSLAKHPIELRLAGLDRDPGWVPAGGRSIYFHYD